jgi:uncharacterized protein (DUF1778 family)
VATPTKRWDFRVEHETDRLVRQAATSRRTLTGFVIGTAALEAGSVLANRTAFVLEQRQWERFVELLDRAPRERPELVTLFSEPRVFSGA